MSLTIPAHPFVDQRRSSVSTSCPVIPLCPDDPAVRQMTLERNLAALAMTSPDAAEMIRRTPPATDSAFISTEQEGAAAASVGGRWLCSRRRPIDEAEAFARQLDPKQTAIAVVLGFGVGRHAAATALRMGRSGVVAVFDNDLPLLRAALERMDHSSWLRETNTVLFTDPADAASVTAALTGHEALVGLGVRLFQHAPSVDRLGRSATEFAETLSRVVSAMRTQVVTTMVQTTTSMRNSLMNAEWYAGRPGLSDLKDCCAGRAAVVVAAGPSLRRNLRLLGRPGVREQVVIVATQTVLRPMLDAGIKPHFVTALDHHEISARFYEGLNAEDVRGVTLVAEAKGNPRILDSFPGLVRCVRDETLERVLGPELSGEHAALTPGATVAHLAYYLARFLGCDPVALIGQDLGFTDGQYYAAGASIHRVWAGELNEFLTLEMLEWQRIARSQGILRRATDVLGRPVYTDEQMATYLAQFERDFKADNARGLTIIDATEGGVRKAGASPLPLREFLSRYAVTSSEPLPAVILCPPDAARPDPAIKARAAQRLRSVRQGVWRVGEGSRKAVGLLTEMLDHHDDQPRVNALIEKVYALRDQAVAEDPAYDMVHRFNQTGTFRRAKADRLLALEPGLTDLDIQRREIRRDIENVRWLADAADALGDLLDTSIRALGGAGKITRDIVCDESADDADVRGSATPAATRAVAAVIPVDVLRGTLGGPRSLEGGPDTDGKSLIRLTLERLARCRNLDRAVLLTADPEAARALVGGEIAGLRVEIERRDGDPLGRRGAAVRTGRLWAGACWRGGLGGLTVYDELLNPAWIAGAIRQRGIDAALIVGPDWCFVDPGLCDAVIDRWRERPEAHRLVFTQSAPGLCGALADVHVLEDLESGSSPGKAGVFASIGGLLGYIPVRPRPDPIALTVCVGVPPALRDANARWIVDSPAGRSMLKTAQRALGDGFIGASAEAIVSAAGSAALGAADGPTHLALELCADRLTGGRLARWARGSANDGPRRGPISDDLFDRVIGGFCGGRPGVAVSFAGAGDPTLHPEFASLARRARALGAAALHVRTDLASDAAVDALIDAAPEAISVNVLAERPETYAALTGGGSLEQLLRRLERLARSRPGAGPERWLETPWIIPRMTRCDAVYEEVEAFVDRWTMTLGWAVLDPMPWEEENERIGPLPAPETALRRAAASRVTVLCDGTVPRDDHDLRGVGSVADMRIQTAAEAWERVLAARGIRA